jgi:hypothetical protein
MTTITTMLTITAKGGYSYTPDSITVTQPNTTLIYALDEGTSKLWEIVGMTNTDTQNQLSAQSKAPSGNSISSLDANTAAETFDVTVIAQHRYERDRTIRIDPKVHNVPN